jgi:hypothetical protein
LLAKRYLFEFGGNTEFLQLIVERDVQDIRLTADLAVFDVLLPKSRGVVYLGVIPLAAACALETGFHTIPINDYR